jgi:chorismate synthase
MASDAFGQIFRVTTFGESHGPGVGAVIDGCPAGLAITAEEIEEALVRRATGQGPYTSARKEPDRVEILSGVFEGETTGAPVALLIRNRDADPSKYEPIKHLKRPGHANTTYLAKYGRFDYRGGGRASARETAARVAAGVLACKLLAAHGILVEARLVAVGGATENYEEVIATAKANGDSVGGVIEFTAHGVPAGLGDPIYEKLEARLAYAMLSIPSTKGFEMGNGFAAAALRGSENNDLFGEETNRAGGVLGGISTGQPLIGRVAFKPPSSIAKPQETLDLDGHPAVFELPKGSRHDPCTAIRAVPIVEAMVALVLADRLLAQRCTKVEAEGIVRLSAE